MEKLNEFKIILNDWNPNNNLSILKDLFLDYVQVYELIREKVVLGKIDEKVCTALSKYYTHIKKYENEISIDSAPKTNNNIYSEFDLEKLVTRLEEIREEFYITDRNVFFDDDLLEILSNICSTIGEDFYNKFFPE